MKWHHSRFTRKKILCQQARCTVSVFWESEGVILVDVVLKVETVNSNTYVRMLTELRKHIKLFQPYKSPTEILLQHDSSKSHTSVKKTWETSTTFG
jgi:hypothetical protein